MQNQKIKPVFIKIEDFGFKNLKVKIEAYNHGGSIKIKTAHALLDEAEKNGNIRKIIESSSGNLGVSLASASAQRGFSFTCVIDPNTSSQNRKIMEALGAKVICVTKKDENGGFLGTRIHLIKEMLREDPHLYWTNQYKNLANPDVHYQLTAPEICEAFSRIDYVIVGAGTTGTLMGIVRYFKKFHPNTHIIGVDTVGSITFGGKPSKRYIPGLGTSKLPEIFIDKGIDTKIMVHELEAIKMCRWIASSHGFLLGGSSGSVLAAANELRHLIPKEANIVAIAPDLGERYLDTVYSDDWVLEKFGEVPTNYPSII